MDLEKNKIRLYTKYANLILLKETYKLIKQIILKDSTGN